MKTNAITIDSDEENEIQIVNRTPKLKPSTRENQQSLKALETKKTLDLCQSPLKINKPPIQQPKNTQT